MPIKSKLRIAALAGCFTIAGNIYAFELIPPNPSSADKIQLLMGERSCFVYRNPLGVNPYSVKMKNQHITITFNRAPAYEQSRIVSFATLPPPRLQNEYYIRYIDIGMLPAGDYTWGVEDENPEAECQLQNLNGSVPKNRALTVTDGRVQKTAPYALANISGHWWNSSDSGVGLFFWQDEKDNTMGAWFTYDKTGVPKWYVFEPKWDRLESSAFVDLLETSRPPGSALPAVGKTDYKVVGKVRFVLEGESASFFRDPFAPKFGQGLYFEYQFSNEAVKRVAMQRYPGILPRLLR